jgi:hypothetical protein
MSMLAPISVAAFPPSHHSLPSMPHLVHKERLEGHVQRAPRDRRLLHVYKRPQQHQHRRRRGPGGKRVEQRVERCEAGRVVGRREGPCCDRNGNGGHAAAVDIHRCGAAGGRGRGWGRHVCDNAPRDDAAAGRVEAAHADDLAREEARRGQQREVERGARAAARASVALQHDRRGARRAALGVAHNAAHEPRVLLHRLPHQRVRAGRAGPQRLGQPAAAFADACVDRGDLVLRPLHHEREARGQLRAERLGAQRCGRWHARRRNVVVQDRHDLAALQGGKGVGGDWGWGLGGCHRGWGWLCSIHRAATPTPAPRPACMCCSLLSRRPIRGAFGSLRSGHKLGPRRPLPLSLAHIGALLERRSRH